MSLTLTPSKTSGAGVVIKVRVDLPTVIVVGKRDAKAPAASAETKRKVLPPKEWVNPIKSS